MKSIAKTLLAALVTIITAGTTLHAQSPFHESHEEEHGGVFFLGGAASVWSNPDAKSLSIDFCPEVGYLFSKDWGAGLLLAYEHERKGDATASHAYKVSPFVRYYYLHKGPFNLYLDGGAGVNFIRTKEQKLTGYEIGIRPGACVDLTEGICLCLRMGFAGYRKDYHLAEEPRVGSSGFGISFAPEELMIGLELEI